jgi:tetratricopeptide (TPR) repeat protein
VDELVDWVTEVPLLVVATARPELLERRPGWGGGKLNATTLALGPLSGDQTALLISQLLQRSVLPAESQQILLERAGGNPLYAEQFAELFRERGSADDLPLPETLQGIIAARLDGLLDAEKDLLRDAAVVGKVFWTAALGRAADDAATTLHALERKGFVRRQKRSSVEGESEFAFAHALVRDVAYGQIARADRAEKHRHVAKWIEALGRLEDHAEMLAYHWRSALDLARLSGQEADDLVDGTRFALREAGDRAFALNAYPAAERYYADALELWPAQADDRPGLLFKRAHALHIAGDDRFEGAVEGARDALLEAGDLETAAEAESLLAQSLWHRGSRDDAESHLARAEELLAGSSASRAKAGVLCVSARFHGLADENDEALRIATEALALAESLSLDELRAHALTTIGTARRTADPARGTAELESALEIALAANSPIASTVVNNLGVIAWLSGDIPRAEERYREAQRLAERFGDAAGLRWTRGNLVAAEYLLGRWDEAVAEADRFIAECDSSPHYLETLSRDIRGSIRLARGDAQGALEDVQRALAKAREAKDPQAVLPALCESARVHALLGRIDEARELATEALVIASEHPRMAATLSILSTVAEPLGIRSRIHERVQSAPDSLWRDAALAGTAGDQIRAAEILTVIGSPAAAAEARLTAAEELIEAGRRGDGEAEVERALEFYCSVDATFFIQRGEALLASAQRDSA